MKYKCTDFTVDDKCSGCGACCTDLLPLSDAEVRRIKSYVKNHNIKEQRHTILVETDLTCPFRDDVNQKCLIYSIRPAICRSFVCNKKPDENTMVRDNLHKINRVVCMRNEFFGNSEDVEFLGKMLKTAFGV